MLFFYHNTAVACLTGIKIHKGCIDLEQDIRCGPCLAGATITNGHECITRLWLIRIAIQRNRSRRIGRLNTKHEQVMTHQDIIVPLRMPYQLCRNVSPLTRPSLLIQLVAAHQHGSGPNGIVAVCCRQDNIFINQTTSTTKALHKKGKLARTGGCATENILVDG